MANTKKRWARKLKKPIAKKRKANKLFFHKNRGIPRQGSRDHNT